MAEKSTRHRNQGENLAEKKQAVSKTDEFYAEVDDFWDAVFESLNLWGCRQLSTMSQLEKEKQLRSRDQETELFVKSHHNMLNSAVLIVSQRWGLIEVSSTRKQKQERKKEHKTGTHMKNRWGENNAQADN